MDLTADLSGAEGTEAALRGDGALGFVSLEAEPRLRVVFPEAGFCDDIVVRRLLK